MTSTEFRKRFARLEQPVSVTVNGHGIGVWSPVPSWAKNGRMPDDGLVQAIESSVAAANREAKPHAAPDMGECPVCHWPVGDVTGHVRIAHPEPTREQMVAAVRKQIAEIKAEPLRPFTPVPKPTRRK